MSFVGAARAHSATCRQWARRSWVRLAMAAVEEAKTHREEGTGL
jgi:hypothetical protein